MRRKRDENVVTARIFYSFAFTRGVEEISKTSRRGKERAKALKRWGICIKKFCSIYHGAIGSRSFVLQLVLYDLYERLRL